MPPINGWAAETPFLSKFQNQVIAIKFHLLKLLSHNSLEPPEVLPVYGILINDDSAHLTTSPVTCPLIPIDLNIFANATIVASAAAASGVEGKVRMEKIQVAEPVVISENVVVKLSPESESRKRD